MAKPGLLYLRAPHFPAIEQSQGCRCCDLVDGAAILRHGFFEFNRHIRAGDERLLHVRELLDFVQVGATKRVERNSVRTIRLHVKVIELC